MKFYHWIVFGLINMYLIFTYIHSTKLMMSCFLLFKYYSWAFNMTGIGQNDL